MPEISISDKIFPNMHTSDGFTKLRWNSGLMYAVQLTASFIRVDSNSIQWHFYGSFHTSSLWTPLTCTPARDAFCELKQDNASVLLFPSETVDMPVDARDLVFPPDFKRFWESSGGLLCNSKTSRRQLSYADTRYEISMCDLVDSDLEVVLVPLSNVLYVRKHRQDILLLVALSALSLYLFVKTCEHFVAIAHGTRLGFRHSHVTVPFVIALVVAVKMVVAESVLVIVEETTVQAMLCAYTLVYAGVCLWQHRSAAADTTGGKKGAEHSEKGAARGDMAASAESGEKNAGVERGGKDKSAQADFFSAEGGTAIGLLIAAQVLLSIEMNETIDSPFLQIYIVLFGLRNFLKFLNLVRLHYAMYQGLVRFKKTAEAIVDLIVFAVLIEVALNISAENTEDYMLSAASLLLTSVVCGALTHAITTLHL